MNTTSPFSPEQQNLILATAGVMVLLAGWQFVKAFHPCWRGSAKIRYTSLGLATLYLFSAADFVLVVSAIAFVARHPLILPTLPMIGCAALLIGGKLDEWGKVKTDAKPPGSEPPPVESPESERTLIRAGVWYARLLAASLALVLFSYYGHLFGPQPSGLICFGVILFAVLIFLLSRQPLGIRFLRVLPQGLSGRFTRLQMLQRPLQRALMVVGMCSFFSVASLFVTTRGAGGPNLDSPVFASREQYIFSNHGTRTEVSPLRYRIAGVAVVTSLHGATIFVSLLALHALIFGQIPKEWTRDNKETHTKDRTRSDHEP